jgi:hypothetical protein
MDWMEVIKEERSDEIRDLGSRSSQEIEGFQISIGTIINFIKRM